VSAVLQGGGVSGGLSAVASVDDSPDGGVSTVRGGESKLVVFKESETWEVVVVLSMPEEARVKAEVESLSEGAFSF